MRRSNEQLKMYKELYDPDKDVSDTSKTNLLMSVASEADKDQIRQILNRYEHMDAEDIKNQIHNLKSNTTS